MKKITIIPTCVHGEPLGRIEIDLERRPPPETVYEAESSTSVGWSAKYAHGWVIAFGRKPAAA